jgi:hypothetical protein
MNRDLVLEAVERNRGRSILRRFIKSPLRTVKEKPFLLYLISGLFTIACAAAAHYRGVEPRNNASVCSPDYCTTGFSISTRPENQQVEAEFRL